MSLEAGKPWAYSDIKFHGLSLSGIRTCLSLPDFGICFDVAQGLPYALHLKKYFITHGHLDHAAGIPYIISQKAMHNEPTPQFYMPPSLIEPMTKIMNLWQEIEKHEYRYDFHPTQVNVDIELSAQNFIRPFRTIHRIDSFGYGLFHKSKKLKTEYQNATRDEIRFLKAQGKVVDISAEKPLVAFTGDTEIEFLDHTPWVREAQILFVECTYLDDKKTIEQAKKWGHIHLDELIPRLSTLKNERIVLIHASSRYPTWEAEKILKTRIPKSEQDRIVLFPGR